MPMLSIFTASLWYLEYFSYMVVLIMFFFFILYMAEHNNVTYNPSLDKRKHVPKKVYRPRYNQCEVKLAEPPQQTPLCFEQSCIWFCRLVASIATIGVCYFCAYYLLSETKLKFGMFVH